MLGCDVGRSKPESCVFNLHGHQIVAHRVAEMPALSTNPVDGKAVPAMHFGLVLEWDAWHAMRDRLEAAGQTFVVGPYLRYADQPGRKRRCSFATLRATTWNSSPSRTTR